MGNSNDIVERLRNLAGTGSTALGGLLAEAADEIELCRYQVDALIWSIRTQNGEKLEAPKRPASMLRPNDERKAPPNG